MTSNSKQALTHLLFLANDLCLAYGTAIRRIDEPKLREQMVDMDKSHDRLRARVSQYLEEHGETPVQRGDLHGLVERGRVVVGGLQGDEGILRAMADNERELHAALAEARKAKGIPPELTRAIEEAVECEKGHRSFYDRALGIFVG